MRLVCGLYITIPFSSCISSCLCFSKCDALYFEIRILLLPTSKHPPFSCCICSSCCCDLMVCVGDSDYGYISKKGGVSGATGATLSISLVSSRAIPGLLCYNTITGGGPHNITSVRRGILTARTADMVGWVSRRLLRMSEHSKFTGAETLGRPV